MVDQFKIYEELIEKLTLADKDRDHLLSRGFSPEQIEEAQYRTYPLQRQSIADSFKDKPVLGVPGFWKDGDKIKLSGGAGIFIPVRNQNSTIQSLKIRSTSSNLAIPKYHYLSSNPKKYDQGTTAPPAIHYPLFNKPKKIKTLRITEGELKADIASIFTDTYTVSLPGVTLWRMGLEVVKELKPDLVILSFDSDKEKPVSPSNPGGKPFAVAESLGQLYLAIKENGFNAKIEDWSSDYGKGIDDVIMDGNVDKVSLLTSDEADDFAVKATERNFPSGWVYCIGSKRFIHTDHLTLLDKEQFSDLNAEEVKGNAATKAISNPAFPKVDQFTYEPGESQSVIDLKGQRLFNYWTPPELTPTEGDPSPFLEHMEYLFPVESERNIFINFLAHNIQYPGKKIMWALLVQGEPGIGKSYIGHVMSSILGDNNVSLPSNETIHERYTGWCKACSMVIIEELMSHGKLELMNKLKPLITQPIVDIREMYSGNYKIPNHFNFLMFTNYKDSIIISANDRRYAALYSTALPLAESYYKKLWKWSNDNMGVIFSYLLSIDLSNFSSKGRAPDTLAREELVLLSEHPIVGWIRDCIEGNVWPFNVDLVSASEIIDVLPRGIRRVSSRQMAFYLKEAGAEPIGKITIGKSSTRRIHAVRRPELWNQATHEAKIDEYRKTTDYDPNPSPVQRNKPM